MRTLPTRVTLPPRTIHLPRQRRKLKLPLRRKLHHRLLHRQLPPRPRPNQPLQGPTSLNVCPAPLGLPACRTARSGTRSIAATNPELPRFLKRSAMQVSTLLKSPMQTVEPALLTSADTELHPTEPRTAAVAKSNSNMAAVRGTSILSSARRPDTKSHHALIGWFAVRVVEVRASIRNNISPPTCHRSQLTRRKNVISVSMSRGEYPQSFLKGC